ncbi:MAG: hypothetical protein A2Z21_04445 [Candidatus Fraserbacteria bacterium RBG_16_55_9]|uniref:HEPN domain-containing protein n=1 Tax=Fraserbacteria sp. (strain RBG_16_55_9) TaxID=1817864 RepID=A0A1F5USC8_FRAXR|nr:MAG: hypothetical protein A2Z21_04445 [Candidatus Fraserbacteria bacterium RBG_16_55_9]
MPNRARDWLNQALRDLEQAEDSRRAGRHEWACFAAQQAAEKGAPFEHYGPLQSEEAIRYAREIFEFSRAQMA